ncbi:MAG: glycosyltransferase family 2 protein [Phycisphaerae bacterium]|nr:glycosyltransferase family 2 protein [Phycisphaerae bacterium]
MTSLATQMGIQQPETTSSPVLLSVVIPAYNESDRIERSIRRIVEYVALQPYRSEVILVDDGSRDETVNVAVGVWNRLAPRSEGVELRVLRNDRNRGKGYSVRQGMLIARGEWILFTDADLSSPIDQLDRLFAATRTDGADIAIGSRRVEDADVHQPSLRRRVISGAFSWVVRRLGVPGFADTQCGFKLYRRSAGQTIASLQRTSRWSFDVEHLLLADRLGYQVAEVGVRWAHQDGSKVQPVRAAIGAVCDIIRMRLTHRRLGRVNRPVVYGGPPSFVRIGDRVYQTRLSRWPQIQV